jgi:hypothetical protein
VAGLTLARGVEGPSLLLVAYTAVVFIAVAAFVVCYEEPHLRR